MRTNITRFFDEFLMPDEVISETNDNHDIQFATATLLMEAPRILIYGKGERGRK